MKKIVISTVLITFLISYHSRCQDLVSSLGVGLGTEGINFKNHGENTVGFILRAGLGSGYSLESYDLSLSSSAYGIVNMLNTIDYRMYFGFGIDFFYRQNFRVNDDVLNVSIIFVSPVGMEIFPFDNKKFSFTVESQLNFARSADFSDRINGAIDFTYYFSK